MKKRLIIIICFLKQIISLLLKVLIFLEEIGTLYDLLIYLLDNPMTIITSLETQIYFFKAMKTDITDQS